MKVFSFEIIKFSFDNGFYIRDKKDYTGEHWIVLSSPSSRLLAYIYEAKDDVPHGVMQIFDENGVLKRKTICYNGVDMEIDPDTLSAMELMYLKLSGRLPEHLRKLEGG